GGSPLGRDGNRGAITDDAPERTPNLHPTSHLHGCAGWACRASSSFLLWFERRPDRSGAGGSCKTPAPLSCALVRIRVRSRPRIRCTMRTTPLAFLAATLAAALLVQTSANAQSANAPSRGIAARSTEVDAKVADLTRAIRWHTSLDEAEA